MKMTFEREGVKLPFIAILTTLFFVVVCDIFAQAPASELTASTPPQQITAYNYRIDSMSGLNQATMSQFNVKSEFGDSTITRVVVLNKLHFAEPTTMHLYRGNTLISSVAIADKWNAEWIYFNNLNEVVANNTADTFTIKADFPASSSNYTMSSSLKEVYYQNSQGTEKHIFKEVTGAEHHFYHTTANFQLVGIPTITQTNDQNGFTTEMTATFVLNIFANGNTIGKPRSDDFVIRARRDAITSIPCNVSSVTIPNNNIADGSVAQVTVTATILASQVQHPGMYGFEIIQLNWGFVSGTIAYQTWGLEQFKTPGTQYFAKVITSVRSARDRLGVIGEDLYDSISNIRDIGGLVVGEGEELLYDTTGSYPWKRIAFPYPASPSKGQLLEIEYNNSNTSIWPYIIGPKYPERDAGNGFMVRQTYEPLDLVRYDDANGLPVKATYRIVIGTFTGYVVATRAGEFAWRTRVYWGNNASYDSCGSERDLLNLAPSTSSDGYARPVRFVFGQAGECGIHQSGQSSIFRLPVRGIPGCYHIEESTNLRDWQEITVLPESVESPNSDGTYTTYWFLPLSTMSGHFFRAVVN